MKFGYRDRIVLLIVCVIIILGVGGFVFIKPKYQTLKKKEETRTQEQTKWDLKLAEFKNIPTLQNYIREKRNESEEISKGFTDEMDATKLDQFLQEKFLNTEDNIKYKTQMLTNLNVSDESATAMGYYFYTPSVVTYPLVEYADLDGSLAKATQEKRKDADVMSARAAQSVGTGNASFTLHITYANCMKFINDVREYAKTHSDAMLLNSVSFEDCEFNGRVPMERDEDGKVTGQRPQDLPEKYKQVADEELGYTNVTFNYSVFYMQEPTQVDVGDDYNPDIWNGNEWRSYKAPEKAAQ